MLEINFQFFGGRGSGGGKRTGGGGSKTTAKASAPQAHRSWNEIMSDLSTKTSPTEIDFMLNNLSSESAVSEVDKIMGIKRNSDGYPISYPKVFNSIHGLGEIYKGLSEDKKKKVINIIKRDGR